MFKLTLWVGLIIFTLAFNYLHFKETHMSGALTISLISFPLIPYILESPV